jgi:hypothetical protein
MKFYDLVPFALTLTPASIAAAAATIGADADEEKE